MDTLELLVMALGLSTLAGLNLYLTVFLIGVSIRWDWITLQPELSALQVLAHPAVLITAGIFLAVEFIADKVPWVDSLWDTIHTIIRPLGATFLALGALGELDPTLAVVAALFCGGVAMLTHLTKSGARLVVNSSPEPVSNSVVSLAEDAVVAGGLVLLYVLPWLAGGLLLIFLILVFWWGPPFLRRMWMRLKCIHSKLVASDEGEIEAGQLPRQLPQDVETFLVRKRETPVEVAWAVPVFTGKEGTLPGHRDGYLVALQPTHEPVGHQMELVAVVPGKKIRRWQEKTFFANLTFRKRILYDELRLDRRDETAPGQDLRFYKHQSAYFEAIRKWWTQMPR